jgi:hypothetical protein
MEEDIVDHRPSKRIKSNFYNNHNTPQTLHEITNEFQQVINSIKHKALGAGKINIRVQGMEIFLIF